MSSFWKSAGIKLGEDWCSLSLRRPPLYFRPHLTWVTPRVRLVYMAWWRQGFEKRTPQNIPVVLERAERGRQRVMGQHGEGQRSEVCKWAQLNLTAEKPISTTFSMHGVREGKFPRDVAQMPLYTLGTMSSAHSSANLDHKSYTAT